MAFIEFHQPLVTHRKLYALASILKIRRAVAAGHLAFLWCWALDNAPDGDLTGLNPRVIKLAADWPKNEEVFLRALVTAGFIDDHNERRVLHDWDDYAGRLLVARAKNVQRMRDARAAHVRGLPYRSEAEQSDNEAERSDSSRPAPGSSPLVWYRFVVGREPHGSAERQQVQDYDVHPSECVDWAWDKAIGTLDPPRYAKTLFDACVNGGEGHGPRGGNTNGRTATGGKPVRGVQGEGRGRSGSTRSTGDRDKYPDSDGWTG